MQPPCGAGDDATVAHLSGLDDESARDVVAYLRSCDASGDFEGRDAPTAWRARILAGWWRYDGLG